MVCYKPNVLLASFGAHVAPCAASARTSIGMCGFWTRPVLIISIKVVRSNGFISLMNTSMVLVSFVVVHSSTICD